jgi:hypothetical protein
VSRWSSLATLLVKDAYGRVKGDWAVLAADQLLKVNLGLQVASQTILGALPEIKGLRERIVKNLPAFDVAQFVALCSTPFDEL